MATKDFKRKLSAIFSADVKGYSRLMAADESATVKTITAYREIMAILIKQHRGRMVDSPGDNVLAEFVSVVDAVQCAVAVQKEFKARNAELPEDRRMEFRIGVNLGDVIEEEDRIYGDGVNIAARLESLADPGGICISKTAFDQIETKLPLGYEYLGEQHVKNIPKPVGAYRVLMEPRVTVAEEIEKEKAVPLWRRKSILAGGVALLLVVIAALIWTFYFRPPPMEVASVEKMAFPLPDKPSIAVLPFVNMSGDPEQEYFSDGVTEEIITALSKTPKLFVIARNSTFVYKDKPTKVQKVGRELGVKYVLEGSVRKAGDKVRVTAQLVDAQSGNHIWAERYDRELKDIFAIQDDITKNIITEVQVQLTTGEQARFRAGGTKSLDAYLKFLQGWEASRHWNKEASVKARKLAEETITLDPGFQKGYFLLAAVEVHDIFLGLSKSPKDTLMRAIEMAKKSIAIEDSPFPHRVLAVCYNLLRKHDAAIAEAKKAVEMAPNYADAYMILGHVLWLSDMAENAVPVLQKGIRLNPYPPSQYFHNLAFAYHQLEKYEEAIAEAKKAIRVSPKDIIAHRALVSCYALLGREEEARAAAAEVLRIDPDFSVDRWARIVPFKNRDKLKKLIDSYHMAGLK